MRAVATIATAVLAAAAAGACGDNLTAPQGPESPDAAPVDPTLLGHLRALPGVTAEPTATNTEGYQYIVLHFTQPVDHDDPSGPTFQQEVSLLTKDTTSPMIVETDGYWDYTLDYPVELTRLTSANQISIEHRYFAASRPDTPDWSKLTVAQMAADEHAIVTALKTIYTGPYIASGASKGGMTSVYYRRFFPDDVVGTVPYVAPLSFGAPDTRYAAFLANVGTAPCRAAVRDVAIEMLSHRRAALLQRAQDEATAMSEGFTRIAIAPALESSILSVEWSFWQYHGGSECGAVPAITATDDDMWTFLSNVSAVSDNDDDALAAFDVYYYQSEAQLGYPDGGESSYLGAYEMYADVDYSLVYPAGAPVPVYDGGAAMHDIDDFVQHQGSHLLFIYGQWDPWSGGAFTLGAATDSHLYIQASGTHGSEITHLATADRDAALAEIGAWIGAAPLPPPAEPRIAREPPRVPRVPPAIVRALRSHKT